MGFFEQITGYAAAITPWSYNLSFEQITGYTAVALALISLLLSYYSYKRGASKENYLEQDKAYADLLKLSLQYPDLRNPAAIAERTRAGDKEFIDRYNTYAYLIWNCMETFYDLSAAQNSIIKSRQVVDNTWLPAMREENKIHYNWFKQNQRLFKPAFQNYVNNLNDVLIRIGRKDDLNAVVGLMGKQFPPAELKSAQQLSKLIDAGRYVLYIAENPLLQKADSLIGYAFVYVVSEYKSAWLDYIAINPIYQQSGYGTLLFNKIVSTVGGGGYGMFMELDIPASADASSDENRRIKFYERQGAQRLAIGYKLPTVGGALPLYLYFRDGVNKNLLSGELLRAVVGEVMTNVHSDLQCMPAVREEVLRGITDIKLQ